MKLINLTTALLFCFCLVPQKNAAQDFLEVRNEMRQNEWASYQMMASAADNLQTDFNIDIKFYHLSINIDIDNQSISGSTYIELTSLMNNLRQVKLNLHNSMVVTGYSEDAASIAASTNTITIQLSKPFDIGETVKLRIDYQGVPVSPNGTKGFRFTTNSHGVPVVATLSTPYLAHYWFPCKDGPTDKADRTYIDITIPQETYNGFELKAISNGLLTETTSTATTKTFKWRHNYPCVPYYIMVAVSNYDTINRTYAKNGHNFPLEYFVFPPHKASATTGVANMSYAFDAFIEFFGDYPFKNEKYGMTQIGFFGGIENQTNSIMSQMSESWFMTSIHELAHMWFGCSVTCEDWHHIWINEGFATYAEALYHEKWVSMASYHNHMASMRYESGGTLYLQDDSNPFAVFNTIAYDKGAWFLHMLRNVVGKTKFFNITKAFAQNSQFAYKNANTNDFKTLCESISGHDLDDFFDQWIYDEYFPIYKYNFYSDTNEGKTGLTIVQTQESLGRRPVFKMPIDIKFTFADGTTATARVNNDQKKQTYYFNHTKKVTAVAIDPDKWILQTNSLDNSIIVEPTPSSQKQLLAFTIAGQISSTINQSEKSVIINMPHGTILNPLTPTITVSAAASVSPTSGAAQDFTSPKTYRVTAEDGSTQDYVVTVNNLKNAQKQILTFSIDGQVSSSIDQTGKTILVTMPFGTDKTNLEPTVTVSAAASVSPTSGAAQDFTSPKTYTVTAEDGTTQDYVVTVNNLKNTQKQITAFSIEGQVSSSIDQTGKTILVTMPFGTIKTNLEPTVTVSAAASVSPTSGAAQDFTSAKTYTVTAEDGTTQDYLVTW
jgi:hypothetical protein